MPVEEKMNGVSYGFCYALIIIFVIVFAAESIYLWNLKDYYHERDMRIVGNLTETVESCNSIAQNVISLSESLRYYKSDEYLCANKAKIEVKCNAQS